MRILLRIGVFAVSCIGLYLSGVHWIVLSIGALPQGQGQALMLPITRQPSANIIIAAVCICVFLYLCSCMFVHMSICVFVYLCIILPITRQPSLNIIIVPDVKLLAIFFNNSNIT